jgi:hypothetical protein
MRDIRDHIAKTKQNDPNNFERPEFRRYPLMPTDKDGKPFRDDRKKIIRLMNAADEDEFKRTHPDWSHIDPMDQKDELQRLRDENARLKAAQSGGSTAPVTGKTGDQKQDGSTEPPSTAKVQEDAAKGSGVGSVAGLVKDEQSKPKAPKPGSKLD